MNDLRENPSDNLPHLYAGDMTHAAAVVTTFGGEVTLS
jgi:hypothetical protein